MAKYDASGLSNSFGSLDSEEAIYLAAYTGDANWTVDEVDRQVDANWDQVRDSLLGKGLIKSDGEIGRELEPAEKTKYRKALKNHEQQIFKGYVETEAPSGRHLASFHTLGIDVPVQGNGEITPRPGDVIYTSFEDGEIVERLESGGRARKEFTYREDGQEYLDVGSAPDVRVFETRFLHPEIKVLAGISDQVPANLPSLFYDRIHGLQQSELEETKQDLIQRGLNPEDLELSDSERRAVTNIVEQRRRKHRLGSYTDGKVQVPSWGLTVNIKENQLEPEEGDTIITSNTFSSGPLKIEYNLDSEQ